MRPGRPSLETCDIAARARCRACGKTGELVRRGIARHRQYGRLEELERRLRCTDFGERGVSVEPIFHPDWR
jgi:hypothetical protein